MRKFKTIAFILFALIAFNVHGQINVGLTVGPQLPMGDFGDIAKTGFGVDVVGKYMLNDNMAVGLNVGYISFGKYEVAGVATYESSMMPITALYEYYFGTEGFVPYVGADLGMYSYTAKSTINLPFLGETEVKATKSYFGFAPKVGVLYDLNDKVKLEGNIKYHIVSSEGSSTTFLGINVGAILAL